MQYNYQTHQLLDKGVNFATIYPEKQGVVKEMTGFDFDLVNIVSFLKKETDNFTILLPLALEIDKNIVSIYNKCQASKGCGTPEPKPEPIPEPIPEPPKDERPSVALLTIKLKNLKKMYAKTPTPVLKTRVKIVEKQLAQPEKFCCGGKMSGGGKTGSTFPYAGEGFTIVQMREFLNKKFVDSFGFKVFPIKKETTCTADYDAEIVKGRTSEGLNDSDIGSKLYFPQYKRDHEINYEIQQGGENTYYDFLLNDEKGNAYAGTFGFKDRGDVGPEHITGFLVFLQEQYGLPFQTEHNVYSGGGYVGKTAEKVWDEWNSGQRQHFLIDHNDRKQFTEMSIEDISKKAYNFIPTYYKNELEKHVTMGQYSTGGELKTELKRLNEELALTERGTPERMEVLGKINMLKHNNPELRKFDGGGDIGGVVSVVRYHFGEYSEEETITKSELADMIVLGDELDGFNVREEDEGKKFFAYENDIDGDDDDGYAVSDSYAVSTEDTKGLPQFFSKGGKAKTDYYKDKQSGEIFTEQEMLDAVDGGDQLDSFYLIGSFESKEAAEADQFSKGGKITYKITKETRGKASHYSVEEFKDGKSVKATGFDTKKEAEDYSGFSNNQKNNIKKILEGLSKQLTGDFEKIDSGGNNSHIFIQLKDNTWVGFHNSDMITLSKVAKTKKAFKKLSEDGNWDGLTYKQLTNYTDAKGDFADVKLIVDGILKNKTELINK